MRTNGKIEEIYRVINGEHKDPFSVLGMHVITSEKKKCVTVRAYLPYAKNCYLIDLDKNEKYEMDLIDDAGFFEIIFKDRKEMFKYKLMTLDNYGVSYTFYDPYSFWPVITDYDLYLFNEGKNMRIFDKLGAHIIETEGITGVLFAVWAPNAKRVSVVGNFNGWDGRRYQMRMRGTSGVWEIFIPELGEGEYYKYEIKAQNNDVFLKADPYGYYSELKPKTASIVYNLDKFTWNDSWWMENRSQGDNTKKPMSIYEVHLGSWMKPIHNDEDSYFNYRELADRLLPYVKEMNYTHIELLPVAEHPFDGSWGYQVCGYYAATSRYGTPEDLMYFINRFHEEGIGVLVDWVPAHFPKDAHGLARFDGSAVYEHADPRQGEHPDWGTLIFNFGRNEVKNFLIANALFWFEKYHIDGLRIDAVASMLYLDYGKKEGEWIPNKWGGRENVDAIEFMRELNKEVYAHFPNVIMAAEESTSWALVTKPTYVGGLGYSFKWNMGWMNDFLRYMSMDSIYRKYHHTLITFSMWYAYSENFILVLSHDEVVHGKCSMINKMPGDYWQKFANLRAAYGFMYGHPGKKLMFMGDEFAQFIEWNYHQGLDWHLLDYDMHKKMQNYVRDLNALYRETPALWELDCDGRGFEWIDCNDAERSVISFLRRDEQGNEYIFVSNFTPVRYDGYRIGVPGRGYYKEIFNSDWEKYGGSNVSNGDGLFADDTAWHGRLNSIVISVPPLATVIFKKCN